jgi:hypothetical protein
MRNLILSGLGAVALAACGQGDDKAADPAGAPAAKSAAAAGLPTGPTPGLWRVTTQISGMPAGATPPAAEVCIREARFEAPQGPMTTPGMNCEQQAFRREGDTVVGRSVCTTAEGVRMSSDMRVSGDFTRRYTMEIRSTTTPAPDPSMASMTMVMMAERLGDCPAAANP